MPRAILPAIPKPPEADPTGAGAPAAIEIRPVPRQIFVAGRPRPRPEALLMLAAVSSRTFVSAPRPLRRALDEPRRGLDPAESARLKALLDEASVLAEAPPTSLKGASDLACLAVSVYHEARNQPRLGQRAVASVILRRAEVPRWGETVCDVLQPVQFSYLAPDRSFAPIAERAAWRESLTVAIDALLDGPLAEVAGADHYHATYVSPAWREHMRKVVRIGKHIFYRDPLSRDPRPGREQIGAEVARAAVAGT